MSRRTESLSMSPYIYDFVFGSRRTGLGDVGDVVFESLPWGQLVVSRTVGVVFAVDEAEVLCGLRSGQFVVFMSIVVDGIC